jgi:hypothetical protein
MNKHLHKASQITFRMLIAVALSIVGTMSYAQVSSYVFTASSGTYTPLVGGTATSLTASADDAISTAFNIGFNFTYNNVTYTQVMACSNGPLLFGTGRTQSATNNLATTTSSQRPGVAALWDDLLCNSGVTYQLSGSSPYRVLTVEWANMRWNYQAAGGVISFQVKLYETTNKIEFIYDQGATAYNAGTTGGASIGIMGTTSTDFISLQDTTAAPATSTTTSKNNINGKPASGQIYAFEPPPCSGTPTAGTPALSGIPGCGATAVTINLTGGSTGPGISYQWQSSSDSINWGPMLFGDTLTNYNGPSVFFNTYIRRVTYCNVSGLNAGSAGILVRPVYGGTAASTLAVCGDSITLSLTNNTTGASYQWESSPDSFSWSPVVVTSTSSTKLPSPTSVTYYRATVMCSYNSASAFSAGVKVLPISGGTTSITSNLCNDSTLLSVTGSSTGAGLTYQWESSPDSLNWSIVPGATLATYKFNLPGSFMFYRRVVYCGISSATSTAVRVINNCAGFGYSVARTTGITYTSIQSTGSDFTWNNTSGDDDRSVPVYFPAGFNFSYNGGIKPAFYVCTNGWLSFDTTNYSTAWGNDLTLTGPKFIIAPFWEDLVTLGNTNANKSYIKYSVTGTAPNRVMTVEWAEMERYQYASPSLNFQVKFYEGSNNIEYVYGKMQPFDGSGTGDFNYSVGMTGNAPALGQRLSQLLENSTNFSIATVNNALPLVPACNSSLLFTAGGSNNYTNVSAVPSNDSSATPVVLTVNAVPCTDGCGTYYTSKSATPSNMGVAPPTSTPDDDVWFKFTAPASGQVSINVFSSSGYDPAFQVMTTAFDSAGLGAAWFRNANTNALEQTTVTGLTFGVDYLIRVYHAGAGFGSTSGAFSICVNEVIPAPANNDTSGAVLLTVNTTSCSPVSGTTLGASASPQAVCGGLADDDVWYKFVANNATDTIRVLGSGTFRAHVQILNRQMTSLYCQNTSVNAGEVVITTNNLLLDSTYFIRIYHTNAGTASANFTVCVTGAAATVPLIATGTIANLTLSSVSVVNSIINGNGGFPVTRSGVLISTAPTPTISSPGVIDSMTNPLVTSGSYSINAANLFPSTVYYARAYAVNAVGVGYGADSMFITPATAVVPTVNTVAASSLSAFSGTMGGNIASDGGAAVTTSGIVYSSTNNNPMLFGFGVTDTTTNPLVASGSFSINVGGLTQSTKYYFRAYATNSAGTAYGLLDSFITSPVISVLPYTQNFDLPGNTGWGSVTIGTGNDWVVGTPAKTVISAAYSAPNCWITKLTGNYVSYHNAAVVSPQFDFTTFPANPILRFKHKFVTENSCCDGGWVEISINGGAWTKVENVVGTGPNYNTPNATGWYNYTIGAGNAWNGNSTTSHSSNVNGWITSSVPLPGAAGQNDVKVRFVFFSDVSAEFDGWAIDDIEVYAPSAPSVLTDTKMNITYQSARVSGNITNNNGSPVTANGVVFSLSPSPTIGGFGVVDSPATALPNGGTFSVDLTGLSASTTYYYRAYATNAMGTTYGADSTFTTFGAAVAPTVVTGGASNITSITARLAGDISSDGGATVTASGVVYSTTVNPVLLGFGVTDAPTSPVVTTGAYQLNISGLTAGVKYYYRAYATNGVGTSYSTQDSFTTDEIVATLPYNQNFDVPTQNNSWKTVALGGTNQWELVTPSKLFLNAAHSGTKAWITKPVGDYDNSVDNALMSPQFNFSGLTEDPVLRFYQKFVTEQNWDGMLVEVSRDGGSSWVRLDSTLGTGGNFNTPNSYAWYNNTSTSGPVVPYKFASTVTGDGTNLIYSSHVSGWVESATRLTNVAGLSDVRFRFRFGSDGSGQEEGWLIDDIEVASVTTPSTAASSVISTPANTSANVSWTNGNGNGRIVVARLTSTTPVAPTNWILYNANAAYGSGSVTGTGNYVVYNGTGSSVNVTGLTALTNYTFDVYEYNGRYMHVKFGSAGSGNVTTTPVKLVSFAAVNNNGDGYLTWATSSEKNNAGFNVERSTDGKHFEYVAFVKGANNSNTLLRYAYSDANVFKATGVHKVYYRLKQIDRDGKFEYSNVVAILEEGTSSFAVKAYPVPFVKDVTLTVTANEQGTATIQVMDIQGRVITNEVTEIMEGENAITLSSLNDLNTGVYFIKVVQKTNTQTVRVVKAD